MKNKIFRIILLFTLILGAIFAIISYPIIINNNVIINGLENVSKEEILKLIDLQENNKLIIFSTNKAKKTILKKNHYIEDVSIKVNYLKSELEITVKERTLSGYVEDKGNYLYIDDNGIVVDIKTFYKKNLPILVGLKFDKFVLGERLKVKNELSFETLVNLNKKLNKYNMESEVLRVNVEDLNDILIFVGNVIVKLGDSNNLDEKIVFLKGILPNIPNQEMKWILDIDNEKKMALLKLMV